MADDKTTMRCYCCDDQITRSRKVQLRPARHFGPGRIDSPSQAAAVAKYAASHSTSQNMTFRCAFICDACYQLLDNPSGVAEVSGHGVFNLAGASRGDKAAIADETTLSGTSDA